MDSQARTAVVGKPLTGGGWREDDDDDDTPTSLVLCDTTTGNRFFTSLKRSQSMATQSTLSLVSVVHEERLEFKSELSRRYLT